jgi:cbb3-type cytochrome oxidase subunit 3
VHLADVVSHAGLSGYAIVAMILFMLAFGGIVWRIFQRSRRDEYERVGRLPLEDDAPSARSPGESA